MNRRTFLLLTGCWLAIAALAPSVPGCVGADTAVTTTTIGSNGPTTTADDSSFATEKGPGSD